MARRSLGERTGAVTRIQKVLEGAHIKNDGGLHQRDGQQERGNRSIAMDGAACREARRPFPRLSHAAAPLAG